MNQCFITMFLHVVSSSQTPFLCEAKWCFQVGFPSLRLIIFSNVNDGHVQFLLNSCTEGERMSLCACVCVCVVDTDATWFADCLHSCCAPSQFHHINSSSCNSCRDQNAIEGRRGRGLKQDVQCSEDILNTLAQFKISRAPSALSSRSSVDMQGRKRVSVFRPWWMCCWRLPELHRHEVGD